MNNELRNHISEVYDGGSWEAITGILWKDGEPWQLFKFEQDVDFEGEFYRCCIISKSVYDPDDVESVDYTEDVFCESWVL